MDTESNFKHYLAVSACATAIACLACALLVALVDPYRLYGLVTAPGVNQTRPPPERHRKEIKLVGARAVGANLMIVGNSRAEIGLDPDDPALAQPGVSAYNMALAGTRIGVARYQLDQLRRHGVTPRHLIVGAEFFDFLADPAAPLATPALPPAPTPWSELAWQFDALFSLDSVLDAARTVRSQGRAETPLMSARGFNPLREYTALARDEGYHALFRQRAADYAARLRKLARNPRQGAAGSPVEFEQIHAVLEQGLAAGARVDIVIYPYHAQLMALIDESGLAPVFEAWKARLAAQVAALRAAHPQRHIALWDFSGYWPYQCEAIPAPGDRRTQTRWYWEGGHFKAALGSLMLARLQSPDPGGPGFGTLLTPATEADNTARIAGERALCIQAAPALFTEAAALLRPARP